MKFIKEVLTRKTTFTCKEDKFIRENYLIVPVNAIARRLNRSGVGILGRLRAMNLIFQKKLLQREKEDSHYKVGSSPKNKGKKQESYMSLESLEKTKATRFKKVIFPCKHIIVMVSLPHEKKMARTKSINISEYL